MSSIGNQGRAGSFIVPANELRGGAGGEGGVRGGRGEGGENVSDGELWTCWWTRRWVDMIDVGAIFIQKFPPRCRWNKNVINR